MSDDLYQKAIVEAAVRGARDTRLGPPAASATTDNPLCGDRVTFDVRMLDGRLAEVGYRTRGCKLCEAATALLAEAAPGRDRAAVAAARAAAKAMLEGDAAPPWESFAAFTPVRRHKSRHACVLLPFDALEQAMGEA
jgi:nitrogen fixation NifU-like protein